MSTSLRWIGIAATRPLRFARKDDNPQPNHYIMRKVHFGLSGWSWCAFSKGGSRVLMPDGASSASVHQANLIAYGPRIGLRDMTSADHCGDPALAEAWRASVTDMIDGEMRLAGVR